MQAVWNSTGCGQGTFDCGQQGSVWQEEGVASLSKALPTPEADSIFLEPGGTATPLPILHLIQRVQLQAFSGSQATSGRSFEPSGQVHPARLSPNAQTKRVLVSIATCVQHQPRMSLHMLPSGPQALSWFVPRSVRPNCKTHTAHNTSGH